MTQKHTLPKQKYSLQVRLMDGTVKHCEVEVSPGYPGSPSELQFSGFELEKTCFNEYDAFENLHRLREELAKVGAIPLCAGARVDVWPSGMSRDMSGGFKAYIKTMSEEEKPKKVDIFDYAPPEMIGSLAEQKEFNRRWWESRGIHL